MCKSEPQAAYEFLCKIKQDLKTKNRFSCDPRFDQAIDLYAQEDFLPHILILVVFYIGLGFTMNLMRKHAMMFHLKADLRGTMRRIPL